MTRVTGASFWGNVPLGDFQMWILSNSISSLLRAVSNSKTKLGLPSPTVCKHFEYFEPSDDQIWTQKPSAPSHAMALP